MLVRQHTLLITGLCLGFCTPGLRAAPTPAAIFGDGMVLQRDRPLNFWGTALKNERVTVEFAGQTKTVNADDAGRWTITLKA
ncbi:MAG: sialate O-acetylesterase, partial [Planctomycetota bacterium]|nr:sialate O-acetylesterase [Planctomycetota bacterium]